MGLLLCSGFLLVGIAAFIAMCITAANYWTRTGSATEMAFRQYAGRVHGAFTTTGWLEGSRPVVQFRFRETPVRLESYAEHGFEYTSLTIPWPELDFACGIATHRFGISSFLAGYRQQPVVIELPGGSKGEPGYAFGFDEPRLRRLIPAVTGRQLQQLEQWRGGTPVAVILAPPNVTVHKRTRLTTVGEVQEFVRQSVELFEHLRLQQPSEITFATSDEAQVIQQMRCQVCGESIEHELVVCRRCQSPHHRECWEYAGGCSIYGCGEKQCDHV